MKKKMTNYDWWSIKWNTKVGYMISIQEIIALWSIKDSFIYFILYIYDRIRGVRSMMIVFIIRPKH
jgi:hypothetical protein